MQTVISSTAHAPSLLSLALVSVAEQATMARLCVKRILGCLSDGLEEVFVDAQQCFQPVLAFSH